LPALDLNTLILDTHVEVALAVVVPATFEALGYIIGSTALHLPAVSLKVDTFVIVGADIVGAARAAVLPNQLAAIPVTNAPIAGGTAAFTVAGLTIRHVAVDTFPRLAKAEATVGAFHVSAEIATLSGLEVTSTVGTSLGVAGPLVTVWAVTTTAVAIELADAIDQPHATVAGVELDDLPHGVFIVDVFHFLWTENPTLITALEGEGRRARTAEELHTHRV